MLTYGYQVTIGRIHLWTTILGPTGWLNETAAVGSDFFHPFNMAAPNDECIVIEDDSPPPPKRLKETAPDAKLETFLSWCQGGGLCLSSKVCILGVN